MAEVDVELPLDIIEASPGFAFDIGGSLAKVIYRPRELYKNGKPRTSVSGRMGKLRHTTLPKDDVERIVDLILDKCDLTINPDGSTVVHTTGLGGNKHRFMFEQRLNIKLKNWAESSLFVDAARNFLKTQTADQLFRPLDKKGFDRAQIYVNMGRGANKSEGTRCYNFIREDLAEYDRQVDDRFPCIIAMCGSTFGFIKIDKPEGPCQWIEGLVTGGQFFLGNVSYLTGITDFEEISRLIRESNGRTVDIFLSDLVDTTVDDDIYSNMDGEFRAFPFAKGIGESRDKATKGDLIHSLLESVCDNLATFAGKIAMAEKVGRVYFCGNFINTPKAQMYITGKLQALKHLQELQVNFEFLRDGGMLGAIGAFMSPYNMAKVAP